MPRWLVALLTVDSLAGTGTGQRLMRHPPEPQAVILLLEDSMRQKRAEVRVYISAAAFYNQQAINAEGLVSYMQQLPACVAR